MEKGFQPVIDDNKAAVATYPYFIGGILLLVSISIITVVLLSVLIGVGIFDKDNDSCLIIAPLREYWTTYCRIPGKFLIMVLNW